MNLKGQKLDLITKHIMYAVDRQSNRGDPAKCQSCLSPAIMNGLLLFWSQTRV